MRSTRLYTNAELEINIDISLDKDQSHYLSRVLRVRLNHELILFNGQSCYEFHGKVIDINKNTLTIKIENKTPKDIESPLSIHLGQSISKGQKLDFIIQKSSELGVKEITPLITERSESRKSNLEKKLLHWQKIAISTAEQCGRIYVTKINTPLLINEWLNLNHSKAITLDPLAKFKINANLFEDTPTELSILIGPEGGLSSQEITLATTTGFQSISLGPRILRTETAPLTIISIAQNLWGDL
jgi:16S rRNA (uracil1498-N3)-methyltransferase